MTDDKLTDLMLTDIKPFRELEFELNIKYEYIDGVKYYPATLVIDILKWANMRIMDEMRKNKK